MELNGEKRINLWMRKCDRKSMRMCAAGKWIGIKSIICSSICRWLLQVSHSIYVLHLLKSIERPWIATKSDCSPFIELSPDTFEVFISCNLFQCKQLWQSSRVRCWNGKSIKIDNEIMSFSRKLHISHTAQALQITNGIWTSRFDDDVWHTPPLSKRKAHRSA